MVAYEEFATYGKDKTSLNNILKEAGISKGGFYYHFKDKEDLFQFLLFYALTKTVKEFDEKINWNDGDFIRRVCDRTKFGLNLFKENPYLLAFAEKYRKELFDTMGQSELNDYHDRFYKDNIDFSLFKDEYTIEDAIHIIRWTYKGIDAQLLGIEKSKLTDKYISKLTDTCERYYDILAASFYVN